MKILIVGILILLINYQSSIDKKHAITDKYISTNMIDTSLKLNIEYPIQVEYTNEVNADTMFFNLGDDRLLVTPNGVVKRNNELYFDIQPEGNIQKLFPLKIGDDLVLIYSFSTPEGESGSYAKRISLKQKKSVWEASINGFNLMQPILVGGYMYLSTIGFVGKMNISNGKFIWQFDDFFKKGNFVSFNEPIFYKDSIVLFTEKSTSKVSGCSILIDNRNSRVLKIKL
jgi:hypothetical protein